MIHELRYMNNDYLRRVKIAFSTAKCGSGKWRLFQEADRILRTREGIYMGRTIDGRNVRL